MKVQPLNSDSVVNKIYDMFCDSIFSGELKPGDKIPNETELSEKLKVGRNSVREAKKMLSAIGVFKDIRGTGTFIADKISPRIFNPLLFSMLLESQNSDDVYELKLIFEVGAMNLAIEKATDEEIKQVGEFLASVESEYKKGNADIEYFLKSDLEFHSKVFELAKNPLVQRMGETIGKLFVQFMYKSLEQPGGIERALKNHREIIEVLEKRDLNRVEEVAEETMEEWKKHWE